MPQRILCEACGRILYEGMEIKPPYEIIELYEGKCPRCSRKLSSIPENVRIKRLE